MCTPRACHVRATCAPQACDSCKAGFYGLSADVDAGCSACDCDADGTDSCDVVTGECECGAKYAGPRCAECAAAHFAVGGQCFACNEQCSQCVAAGRSVGAANSACVTCAAFREGAMCVAACSTNTYPDADSVCRGCNARCVGGCTGPAASECASCLAVRFDGACVDACPAGTFANSADVCEACADECAPNKGCSGLGPVTNGGRCSWLTRSATG
jgi:hypothetical protein